jgi:hypothetical protein
MTETPSGNRWEPADDDTAPVKATAAPPVAGAPTAEAAGETELRPRPDRRRTGLLAAGAAGLLLASGAGGYAIGSAGARSGDQDFGATRQAPPGGSAPGQGLPGQDGRDDHTPFDAPDGSTGGEAG